MSDQEPETQSSALGKRARDGEADGDSTMEPPAKPSDNGAAVDEDSDDDDVGPMPMPDTGAAAGGVKKKRKGASCRRIWLVDSYTEVLCRSS